jgi:hypothetical protein
MFSWAKAAFSALWSGARKRETREELAREPLPPRPYPGPWRVVTDPSDIEGSRAALGERNRKIDEWDAQEASRFAKECKAKRAAREAAGWKFGDAGDFLGLSDAERRTVEARVEKARATKPVEQPARVHRWAVVGQPNQMIHNEPRLLGQTADARTKSEARAAIKRRFCLRRLPAGVALERVGG